MPYRTGQGVRGEINDLPALGSRFRIVDGNFSDISNTLVVGTTLLFPIADFSLQAVASQVQSSEPLQEIELVAPTTPRLEPSNQ